MLQIKKHVQFLYPKGKATSWNPATKGSQIGEHQNKMSYRGRPSKGCQMCRSRKVKCDESKPICNRCRDAGHECVYRDNFELFFRDQTASTARRAQKHRKRSQQPSNSPEPGSSSRVEASQSPSDPSQPSKSSQTPSRTEPESGTSPGQIGTSRSPSASSQQFQVPPNPASNVVVGPGLRQAAIDRFFFDYVLSPDPIDHPQTGFLSHLPFLFGGAEPDSALATAVTAAAFANYAQRTPNADCETYGLKYYVNALNLMGQAVQDPNEVGSIETLLTSFVLGLYEVITPTHVSAGQASWVTHRDGGSLLLSLRGPQQFQELVDARLFGITYVQMIINCLAEGKRPPVAIESWANHIDSLAPFVSETHILRLMHRTADLSADWTEYKIRISSSTATLPDHLSLTELLLSDALSLDTEFEDWNHYVKNLGPEWSFESGEIGFLNPWEQDLVDLGGGPFVMHQYRSPFVANIWNLYRASRIRLNGIILRLMQRLAMLSSPTSESSNPGSKENQAGTQTLIRSLLDDICSSTIAVLSSPLPEKPPSKSPQEICGVRGYYLLWPLITCKKYLGIMAFSDTVEREKWVQNVLGFIRFNLGIGTAQTDLHESAEI